MFASLLFKHNLCFFSIIYEFISNIIDIIKYENHCKMINNYYDINKVIIHQILVKYEFYHFPIDDFVQMLKLLEMPILNLMPKVIQDNVFTGLLNFAEKDK